MVVLVLAAAAFPSAGIAVAAGFGPCWEGGRQETCPSASVAEVVGQELRMPASDAGGDGKQAVEAVEASVLASGLDPACCFDSSSSVVPGLEPGC